MKQFTEIDDFIKSTQDKCYMLILCCIIFVILIVYLLRKYRNFNALLASFQDTVNQNSYRVIKYNETNLLLLQDLKKMNQKILHQNDNQEKLEIKLKQAKNDNILLNDQILNKNKKLEIQDNNLSVYNSTIKMLEKNQEKIEHEMLLKIQDLNSNELNYKSMEQDNYRLKQVNETMATELSEFKKQEKLLQSQIDFHQTEWDILNEAIQYSDEIDLTKLETKDIKKMATHQEYANLKILKLKHINEIDTQVLHDIQIKLTDFQIENDQLKNEIKELNYSLENKKIETNCESCQNMEPNNDKFEEILLEIKNLSIDIYNMMQLFEDGEQINKDKLKDCKKETTQVKLRLKRITEESRILRMRLTAAETKN